MRHEQTNGQGLAALAETAIVALVLIVSCTATYSAVNLAADMVLEGRGTAQQTVAK